MARASGGVRMGRAAVVAAALLGPAAAAACTFFAVRGPHGAWAGNSEDFNYPRSLVWFQAASPGRHGRIVFGFESGEALGGMNDQGLAFDWVAMRRTGWLPDPALPPAPGALGEVALERAATVEEAIALFRRFNEAQLSFSQAVLADRTGDAAVISWADGRLRVERTLGRYLVYGFGERPVRPLLERLSEPSAEALAPALRAALQGGPMATKYSTLYDLQGLRVHAYDLHRGQGPFVFDLAAELARGDHHYELLALPAQLERPPPPDARALPPVPVSAAALAAYAGRYRSGDTVHEIALESGELTLESSADLARRHALVPVGSDRFVVRNLRAELRFERGAAGEVTAAVVQLVSIGSAERPVPNPQTTFRLERMPGEGAERHGLYDLGPVVRVSHPAGPVASIRARLAGGGEQAPLWAELARALAAAHVAPAGPGYTISHWVEGDGRVNLEAVQPVAAPGEDAGRVRFSASAPVEVVSVVHHGPYATLPFAYGALDAWMRAHGLRRAGPSRESYRRGAWSEPDPRAWETVVEIPVAGAP